MRAFVAATIVGLSLSLSAGATSAASVTFNLFATTTDNAQIDSAPVVTVDDDTAGQLTFTVSIPVANAELSGVFVDFFGDPDFDISDVASLTTDVSIVDFAEDTNTASPQENLNGGFGPPINGGSGDFDIAFGLEDTDRGGNQSRVALPFEFSVLDDGGALTILSVARVGLRFQSVGEFGVAGLGGGSEKLISVVGGGPQLNIIPVPAALPMMATGIGAFMLMGWRRRKAA